MNIYRWILAARLRTLPLSFSGVLLGVIVGVHNNISREISSSICIAVLVLFTAILLQVLSNFANDYGDSLTGLDNEKRIGPKRAVQQGLISLKEMKIAIIISSVLACITGISFILLSFGASYSDIVSFIILGGLSIVAAITYTVGLIYGYKGLGDVSVFIFFGLVSVLGAEYVMSHMISTYSYLLAVNAGLMSILVLNVNNLRDYESDAMQGKKSLVVIYGLRFGKIYHFILFSLTVFCSFVYLNTHIIEHGTTKALILNVCLALCITPLYKSVKFCVKKDNNGGILDPFLKKTSISSAIINLYFSLFLLFI
jgi:1,4-dihydroxy-2-naphthoate octaprenyltransferase